MKDLTDAYLAACTHVPMSAAAVHRCVRTSILGVVAFLIAFLAMPIGVMLIWNPQHLLLSTIWAAAFTVASLVTLVGLSFCAYLALSMRKADAADVLRQAQEGGGCLHAVVQSWLAAGHSIRHRDAWIVASAIDQRRATH
jgi:hypothetical protein